MAISEILEGRAFQLRPVEAADADFAIELRTDPELTRFIPPLSSDRDAQIRWIEEQRAREGDYYWAVERKGGDKRIEGFIGLYGQNRETGGFEWGRWIMRRDSMAAAESVLLMYSYAFNVKNATSLTAQIALENESVVRFHDNCGMKFNRDLPGRFKINGRDLDAVEKILTPAEWPAAQAYLGSAADRVARLLNRRA